MRRQENQTYAEAISYQVEGGARIDPHNLAKYFQSEEVRSKAAKLTDFSQTALFGAQVPGIVQIKGDQLLVECNLSCGLPLIVRVPISYYKGIGARFVVSKREGNPLICILELVHEDPNLCVPVMASADLEEAAVDWQSWSRRFHIAKLHKPLGAQEYEAVKAGMDKICEIASGPQKPRRHHAQFAARRPRFLARRKPAQANAKLARHQGREIIARD